MYRPQGHFVGFGSLAVALMAVALAAFVAARAALAEQTIAGTPAVTQKPSLKVNPKKLNFGTIKSGSIRKKNITIRNSSKTLTLNVSTFLPGVPPFVIIAGGGAFALPPKHKQVVTVQFAPAFQGDYSGFNVEIGSNDPLTPSVTVPLSGKANPRQKPPK
jgi:hypothetical protein